VKTALQRILVALTWRQRAEPSSASALSCRGASMGRRRDLSHYRLAIGNGQRNRRHWQTVVHQCSRDKGNRLMRALLVAVPRIGLPSVSALHRYSAAQGRSRSLNCFRASRRAQILVTLMKLSGQRRLLSRVLGVNKKPLHRSWKRQLATVTPCGR
jgi:hypothetical protein